jgi:hypothetical protein
MEACEEKEVQIHLLLTGIRQVPFSPGERAHGTCWKAGWVDSREGVSDMKNRKTFCLQNRTSIPWLSTPHYGLGLYTDRAAHSDVNWQTFHEHPGGESISRPTHKKKTQDAVGLIWYGMKRGAAGLNYFALHGCRFGIFITELDTLTMWHISATADYILSPLTSIRLLLTVLTERRSSGTLTTTPPLFPHSHRLRALGPIKCVTKRN